MLFAQIQMKIFTRRLCSEVNRFLQKTKNFHRNGFFLLKQTNENMADPQISMLPNLVLLNIISHAMFVVSILQIEVRLGEHIRAQHGMQGTDQKARLTSKRNVEKQEKGKTKKCFQQISHLGTQHGFNGGVLVLDWRGVQRRYRGGTAQRLIVVVPGKTLRHLGRIILNNASSTFTF